MRFILPLLAASALCACEADSTSPPAPEEAAATPTEVAAVPENAPTPPEEPAVTTSGEADDSQCGADKLDRWLNVLPTQTVKDEIAAAVGDRAIRYYTQDDPITMDFSPSRLNVELGVDGRIKLFRCG